MLFSASGMTMTGFSANDAGRLTSCDSGSDIIIFQRLIMTELCFIYN